MSATLASVNSILKEFYSTYIAEQLNQQTLLLTRVFQKARLDWQGRYVVVPVHISRNSGVGFASEGGTLPTPGQQGYQNYQVFAKFLYGTVSISGPTISLGSNAIGVASALEAEMSGIVRDAVKGLNRSLYYGGRVLGYTWTKDVNAGTGVPLQFSGNPNAAASVDPVNTVPVGPGETIQLVSMRNYLPVFSVGPVQLNSVTCGPTSALSLATCANIDTSVATGTTVGGAPIVVSDIFALVHQNPALTERVTGILGNLSDPNQFGIDRSQAANASLRSNFRLTDPTNATYQPFDDSQLQGLCDDVAENSGEYPDMIFCAPKMRRQYTNTVIGTSNANFLIPVDGKKQADAGVAAGGVINFNGLPIIVDPDAPLGQFLALSSKNWKWAEASKGEFVQGTTGYLIQSATTDSYSARWRMYAEAFCDRPNANGILTAVSF